MKRHLKEKFLLAVTRPVTSSDYFGILFLLVAIMMINCLDTGLALLGLWTFGLSLFFTSLNASRFLRLMYRLLQGVICATTIAVLPSCSTLKGLSIFGLLSAGSLLILFAMYYVVWRPPEWVKLMKRRAAK